jgi:hypothetical protein
MPQAIDVFEKYQGTINWAQVAAAGITAVWIKGSNGNQPANPTADTYVHGATSAHIAAGLYGYVTGVAGPVADANALADELIRLAAYGLLPMCDFEDASLPPTVAARRAFVVSFFAQLHLRIPAMDNAALYLAGGAAHPMLDGWWPAGADHMAIGSLTVRLVDAEYSVNNGVEHAPTHYTGPIWGHQYTSLGTVGGVSTKVDRDDLDSIIPAMNPIGVDDMALSDKLPPVKMSDGQEYVMTVGDVLRGMAQYIAGDAAEANTTAHPAGQYVSRIIGLADTEAGVATLAASVAAGFKADAAADAAQSSALGNLTTGLSATQVAIINAVVALPGQMAAGETGTGTGTAMTDNQLTAFATKVAALLGPADAQAFATVMSGLTLHAEFPTPPAGN